MSLLILLFGTEPDISVCFYPLFKHQPMSQTHPSWRGPRVPRWQQNQGRLLGLCPAVAGKPPGQEVGSADPPPANFFHVRAVHNTPENHDSITAAIKLTTSHQPIQLSLITVHFPSFCFPYLSKIPCSPISFLPTKALAVFLKAPTTRTAGILQLVFIHQRYSVAPFIWKCKAALVSVQSKRGESAAR